jgi:hypothetical protein
LLGGGGQGGHVLAQLMHLGQHLLVLAHVIEDLQPPGLVAKLRPRAQPGLAGIADFVLGQLQRLGEPPCYQAVINQSAGCHRCGTIVAAL